jgi:hypothetical protein
MDNIEEKPKISNWKQCPIYIEPYSSISIKSDISENDITNIVKDSLEKSKHEDLSFNFKPTGNKFRGTALNQLNFRINLFRKGKEVIIEFQRTSGCSIQFNCFYTEMKLIMIDNYPDIFNSVFNKISRPLFKPLNITSASTSIFSLEEKDNIYKLYKNLTNISQDKHINVSINGLSSLASCIDNYKEIFVPLSETENFVNILNDIFQNGDFSQKEYIARIFFVLTDYTRFKNSIRNLKESGEFDICETFRICLKTLYPITYLNTVLEQRLRRIVSKFSN